MNTGSPASQTVRDAAKDTARDVREGAQEVRRAGADASPEIQSDLRALRTDLARLAEQVSEIVSSKGNAAWQRAKSGMDDVMADAQDAGREAVGAVREVSDNFIDAIDDSLEQRPYTTLAIVAALGFMFGATWRR